ncbi:hypothetical protein PR048_026275 [Dryococelus australis]|uniref:Uncharacterized protein n=1 Tax=Dryococelus australis TaxID=614101 RepID=A0ABQ9GKY5_9NEOP|nr:hypothetical protein PR048_026275 [Dryococelus australis]
MQLLNDPALKKINFVPLLEETLNECTTPSILKRGFTKCGLVRWNPTAADTSKIPTMDAGSAVTNRSSLERMRSGKAFLGGYIGEGKLQSFQDSGNEWIGDSQDHFLFLLWKKWQLYHENKKEAAMEKGSQKQERAETRKEVHEECESSKKL